jgi:hypothetical protein
LNRILPTIVALLGLLVCAEAAPGVPSQGGYDEATRQLEEGFKIVATERIGSDDECYPPPDEIASLLRRAMGLEVVVTASQSSVQGVDLVNVIADETACNRLVLAIRSGPKGRIFILDSDYGPVYLQGKRGPSAETLAGGIGPLRDLTAATSNFRMTVGDEISRFEVLCPDGTFPIGGGMVNVTPLDDDGEGIYPHSYERLGVQNGFHVTPTLVDPTPEDTTPRKGALQEICGRGLVPTVSPHETVYIKRQGTGAVTATCPEGTQLVSGGFQRTNFTTPGIVGYGGIKYGGNYITESRAVGTRAWRVSAGAVDQDGGELTAIAHCSEDPSLPLTVVSASAEIDEGELGSVNTPRCPPGRALIAGGFDFGGSHDALFAEGYFTRKGTWSTTGFGWFGPVEMTAYGYCLEAEDTVDRTAFPAARVYRGEPEEEEEVDSFVDKPALIAGLGLVGLVLGAGILRRRQVLRRREARRRASRQ